MHFLTEQICKRTDEVTLMAMMTFSRTEILFCSDLLQHDRNDHFLAVLVHSAPLLEPQAILHGAMDAAELVLL